MHMEIPNLIWHFLSLSPFHEHFHYRRSVYLYIFRIYTINHKQNNHIFEHIQGHSNNIRAHFSCTTVTVVQWRLTESYA